MFAIFDRMFKKEESEYCKNYNLAAKNSKKFNLGNYKTLKLTQERLLTKDNFIEFQKSIQDLNLKNEDLVATCHATHINLKQYVDDFYKVDSVITIGHLIHQNGGKMFFQEMDLRINALNNGYDITKPLELHTWLTLPTGEILDFTFLSTLAEFYRREGNHKVADLIDGGIIGGHPDEDATADNKYIPEFLGEEFFERTGLLKHYTGFFI